MSNSNTPARYVFKTIALYNADVSETSPMTLTEAIEHFSYTLKNGAAFAHEKGNKKIIRNPHTSRSLVTNLNNASINSNKDERYAKIYFAHKVIE